MKIRENTEWNYSYYPVLFESEEQLLKVQKVLNENQIFPRRYFYPSLNNLNYVKSNEMPISENVSEKVLCLPLYRDLKEDDLNRILQIINFN